MSEGIQKQNEKAAELTARGKAEEAEVVKKQIVLQTQLLSGMKRANSLEGQIMATREEFAKQQEKLNKNTSKSSKALESFRTNWKSAALVLSGAALAFGGLIKKASDLEETTAKFGTVFTGQMEKANSAVIELTRNYAMSTEEARFNLAAIQDLLVPMGMAADKAGQSR